MSEDQQHRRWLLGRDFVTLSEMEDAVDERLQEEDERRRFIQSLMELQRQGFVNFTKVEDIQVDIVKDPAEAKAFADRHEALLIGAEVAKKTWDADGDSAKMQDLYRKTKGGGGFLQPRGTGYAEEDMRQRILDPHWVMAQASGSIIDPRTMQMLPSRKVADMQLEMPIADSAAELVTYVPHPDDPSAFYDHKRSMARRIAREIHDNHAIAACVSDIGVYPQEYQHKGFASRLQKRVIEHVRQEVNPIRGERQAIRYFVASMFNIVEVRHGGQSVKLQEELRNEVSVIFHALRGNSCLAWMTPPTEVKVVVPSETPGELDREFVIVAGWDTAVIDIADPALGG